MKPKRNLDANAYAALLEKLGACEEARNESRDQSLRKRWITNPSGSNLLWLAARVGVSKKKVGLALCEIASRVTTDDEQWHDFWKIFKSWCFGKATLKKVMGADAANDTAANDTAAYYAAFYANYATTAAAANAAHCAGAAGAAYYTTTAANYAKVQREAATVVRRHITADDIFDKLKIKETKTRKESPWPT